ncbi:MAG: HAMP domain-containing histidine kinase [Ruminococcaceae bacterium]|nr:HAMP domain-containing histidine kinase [Oscillospiraceae bacterium]
MKQETQKQHLFRLVAVDKKELLVGVTLIVASFFMPLMFNVHNFSVLKCIMRALHQTEKLDLVAAAVQLVTLNSIRGIPHYVGAYFVGESLSFRRKGHWAWPVNSLIILVILLLTYWGIGAIHGIRYDFGLPAVLVCFFVFFFRKLHYRYISQPKKASMIVLVLTACQFLDIMPIMSRFPVGRGETSVDIKMASMILEADTALNTAGTAGMLLFVSFALVVFFHLREENSLKEVNFLREQNQIILMQAQLNEMENRTHQEMQYLVHDLKSPLTAVQTLVGVLKMEGEKERRERDVEYLDYIEDTVERMSRMISEILYQDQPALHTTQELVGIALAQSSVNDYADYIRVDNQVPEALVNANRFLFPRALVNLIENSARAMDGQDQPEILLRVDRCGKKSIVFTVQDNGMGIDAQQLKTVWNHGFSGRQSSGLGLPFVHNVVERMNGKIRIKSEVGQGTSVQLVLPEESVGRD